MHTLRPIFFTSFFFSAHLALISYINSSMLKLHLGPQTISTVFATASCISIILLACAPRIIKRVGNVAFSLSVLLLCAALLIVLGTASTTPVVITAFVLYFSLTASILYSIDLFIEHYSAEKNTGNIRGIALTVNNIGWVAMPALVGGIAALYGFGTVYLIAALVLGLAACVIAISQRHFSDKPYVIPNVQAAFKRVQSFPALRRVISLHFLLQFFFSWMVLYVPLYLASVLGFAWDSIGMIISIMLIPFVLFVYPAGRVADKWLGEKELMIAGLMITGVATILFATLQAPTFALIALTLFCTRIGASILEVMCDSYFFKHVNDTDSGVISLYRTMQPFAYIAGPLTGALVLLFTDYTTLFFTLGIIMLLGVLYALRIVDTR